MAEEIEGKAVDLGDVLIDLRHQLMRVQEEGEEQALRLAIDQVELELEVAVTAEARGEAKTRFWVIDAKVDGGLERVATQKIKLSFSLLDEDGIPVKMLAATRRT